MQGLGEKTVSNIKEVRVPDIGNFPEVDVIEVLVKEGDVVKAEDALITLESDKATMDIPAPFGGTVKAVRIKAGEKVAEGSLILTMEVAEGAVRQPAAPAPAAPAPSSVAAAKPAPQPAAGLNRRPPTLSAGELAVAAESGGKVHASPSVRAFARELGVDLSLVNGSGPKRRILKEDVQAFVKAELAKPRGGASWRLEPGPAGHAAGGFCQIRRGRESSRSPRSRKFPAPICTATGSPRPTSPSSRKPTSPNWKPSAKACRTRPHKQGVKLTLPAVPDEGAGGGAESLSGIQLLALRRTAKAWC